MRGVTRKGLCALLAAAAALLLGACGGSSSSSSSSPSASVVPSGVLGARVQGARRVTPVSKFVGADRVEATRSRPVRARAQAGTIDDEVSASGARALDPCSLVSRAQAQAILGKPVGQPRDAPQGPTCIYTPQGAPGPVTLAVVATDFSSLRPQAHLRDRMSVKVSGHAAYCGVAGTPTMIVPLSPGRFLTVAAPCPIAASFAAAVLRHLRA